MSPVAYAQQAQSVEVFTAPRLTHFHREVISELFKRQGMEQNWDGYGSPPPSRELIDKAVYLATMLNFDETTQGRVLALEGGGVQIECSKGNRELHFSLLPEGTVEYLKLEEGHTVNEGPIYSIDQMCDLELWLD
jgi:hypothetical protein